ncbi:MAG: terpene synthase family protein, partial [Cyanobacteria bacterium J06642_11]
MIYFYLVDYIYDDDRETSSSVEIANIYETFGPNVIRLLQGQQVNKLTNLEQAAISILEEFRNLDPDWYTLFTQGVVGHVEIAMELRSLKKNPVSLSLKDYWEARKIDTGGLWSANLVEYAHNYYLTPAQRAWEKIQLATNDMAQLCGIINDMFS